MELKPRIDIPLAAAQAIVDQVLPGIPVAAVTRLHGGEIAAVYEIAFVREAHPPLVLKVYPDDLQWKMRKEVYVLGLIGERLSVAVPRVLMTDATRTLLPHAVTLMTRLDGLVLGDIEQNLSRDMRLAAYAGIGRLLREFHAIPMGAFGYIGANGISAPKPTNRDYLSYHFERKLTEFAELAGPAALKRRVSGYFERHMDLLDGCAQPVLCHNDLHAGNLLAHVGEDRVRLSGVVDFEGALAGDPLMDVAKALYYLDEETSAAVLDGYGETQRPTWRATLRLYHLNFVLELWCWMARIGNPARLEGLSRDLEVNSAG